MSQKTLDLCLERYNFVKFGETTKSSHTVLCINNAYSVNSDKYRLTPTTIVSKHGEGYVFTLNYDFDRPLFTIVQKSYTLYGTSGNIVFEGIDPISKGGSKYLRKVTVSPVKLSDGSYLLEVTKDEYLRIGTTGAALGDEELESLNEKIVATGGIEKSVETVGGKQVLKLDASGSAGAKEIVYFDVDPSDPPSGIYDAIGGALSNNKIPVIKIDGAMYFYTATGTDKYVFVGGYTKEAVGYTEIEVSDDDSVTSKSVDDKVFNMYLLYKMDPASPGDPPGDEDQWICDENKHVITKDEILAAHADCRYFILNNTIEPDSNSRKYFASVTDITSSHVRLRFYMMQYSSEGVAEFYQKTVMDDSEGRLYVLSSYNATLAGVNHAVLVSEPQSFDSTQKAQGRANIGAASASDVTALQSQVSSLSDVSAYAVKGEATVTQLNAGPSGIQAGWAYQLTDSGTLTNGSLAVVAGDTVAWDGTKWFPLVKSDYYATKTYAQNVAHSIAPEYDGTTGAVAGKFYMHEGVLYICKENTSGDWDSSKFIVWPLSSALEQEALIDYIFESDLLSKSISFVTGGYIRYSDGVHVGNANAAHTDYIKVKKGDFLIVSVDIASSGASIACYDSNLQYVQSSSVSSSVSTLFKIPSGVSYIRCSYYGAAQNTNAVCVFVSALNRDENSISVNLKNSLSEFLKKSALIDKEIPASINGYVKWNGEFSIPTTSTVAKMTDFIPVYEGMRIYLKSYITNDGARMAAFDSGLGYLQSKSIQGSDDFEGEVIIPSGVSYVIFSHYLSSEFKVVVKKIQEQSNFFSQFEQRNELYNKSFDFPVSGYLNNSGVVVSGGVYSHTTDWIRVKPGEKYRIMCWLESSGNSLCCYDEQKQFISEKSVQGVYRGLFVVPDGVFYIRCSYYGSEGALSAKVSRISDSLYPNCSNKKILIFGDSITDCANITVTNGVTTSYSLKDLADYDANNKFVRYAKWPTMLSDVFVAAEMRCYARSGATYRNQSGEFRQSLSEQVDLAIADRLNAGGAFSVDDFVPDIVIFALGTNDGLTTSNADAALSKIVYEEDGYTINYDLTLAALDLSKSMDAAMSAFMKIRKYWPMAFGLVVSPIQRMSTNMFDNTFAENLEKIAAFSGMMFANGAKLSNITQFNNVKSNFGATLRDGLHPNEVGQNMMARMIISLVASNYCDMDLFNKVSNLNTL